MLSKHLPQLDTAYRVSSAKRSEMEADRWGTRDEEEDDDDRGEEDEGKEI